MTRPGPCSADADGAFVLDRGGETEGAAQGNTDNPVHLILPVDRTLKDSGPRLASILNGQR